MDVKEYIEAEKARIEQERSDAMLDNGFAPFMSIKEGTTTLTFSMDIMPRESKNYPDRSIFRVSQDNTEYDLSVNRKSPLYKDIVDNLSNGKTTMTITRIGTGRTDTRYKVESMR